MSQKLWWSELDIFHFPRVWHKIRPLPEAGQMVHVGGKVKRNRAWPKAYRADGMIRWLGKRSLVMWGKRRDGMIIPWTSFWNSLIEFLRHHSGGGGTVSSFVQSICLSQCPKLRVHPAPGVHISTAGCTILGGVHPVCAPFFEPFTIAIYWEGAWSNFRVHSFMWSAPCECTK